MKVLCLKVLLLFVAMLCITVSSSCKDPDEYAPPQDSLVQPPAPPQLITPPDSDLFSLTPGFDVDVYFEWSDIADAEFYEIDVSNDVAFGNIVQHHKVYAHSAILTFTYSGDFYWRVRTYSSLWTWYTNWSEVRYFWITTILSTILNSTKNL